LAALVAVPVGAVIAIPAVRLSGVFLALATLGFGIVAQEVFYNRGYMFTSLPLGITDPRPAISIGGWNLSTDKGFYYVLLIFAVLIVLAITAISSGRLGRMLEAMADSPLALETNGASSSVLKVIIFCITAAMASMAGAFTGMLYNNAVGTYFQPFTSVYLFAIVVIITLGDPWYGVIGALAYGVIPGYVQGSTTSSVLQLLFGVAAATAAWGTRQGGAPAPVRALLDRLGGRKPTVATEALTGSATRPAAMTTVVSVGDRRDDGRGKGGGREGLEVQELVVRFGGVVAVSGVSLKAPMGRITGLLGPNGAGKTTLFNACSGLNRPTAGRVAIHGMDLSHDSPARRARRGLGRTFQRPDLFNSLTVRQNVAIGREASMAGANPLAQTFSSRRANRLIADTTNLALALTGTDRIAETQVGLLTIGQRRLVELARALAGPFDMLLLDEPSSGLDAHETDQFGQVVKTVVEQRGCGILLVEHDMSLVRQVCDHIYVIDFGELIFDGTPEEMHASAVVRAAYLGGLLTEPDTVTAAAFGDASPQLLTPEE
jgi:ABC-type branched-subunit amino acid transport system ATPase component/branched-subunit amino acid ABC-type transport system permease component